MSDSGNERSRTITLDSSLALYALLGHTAVLALIVYRRIYKSFPIFSAYLLLSLIAIGMSYLFRGFNSVGTLYLALSFVDAAFIVAVLSELSMSVLRSLQSYLQSWTPLAIAYPLALSYAVIWQFVKGLDALAWLTPPLDYQVCLDLSGSGLQIIYFIAFTGVSRIAGIGWRSRQLQIAAGLGFLSFVNFWTTMVQLNLESSYAAHIHQYHLMDELKSFGWCCLMLYWTVNFARKEREWEPGWFQKNL